MAKRTPRSAADDSATAATPPPASERRARPRNAAAKAQGLDTPALSDTHAARPGLADIHPPADSIAADAGVLGANRLDGQWPTDDEIRAYAYHLYLQRGAQHGMDADDWYRAEQELRGKRR